MIWAVKYFFPIWTKLYNKNTHETLYTHNTGKHSYYNENIHHFRPPCKAFVRLTRWIRADFALTRILHRPQPDISRAP